MTVPVRGINRQRVALQGIILQVELQVFFLALVEERVFALRFDQQTRDIVPRVGLDSRVRANDSVGRQFLQEIIDFRVLDGLRDTLSVGR